MILPVLLFIAGLGVILLLLLAYCTVTKPSRDAARQAEASATLADGRTSAASDASVIRDASLGV